MLEDSNKAEGVIIFLLGRQGSGKTTMAREIEEICREHFLNYFRKGDLPYLMRLMEADLREHRTDRCKRDKFGFFNVTDASVYDKPEILNPLEDEIRRDRQKGSLLTIELARPNSGSTLKMISKDIREKAHAIFLNVPPDIGLKRAISRPSGGLNPPRYDFEDVMKRLFWQDDPSKDHLHELVKSVQIIENASLEEAKHLTRKFVLEILLRENRLDRQYDFSTW